MDLNQLRNAQIALEKSFENEDTILDKDMEPECKQDLKAIKELGILTRKAMDYFEYGNSVDDINLLIVLSQKLNDCEKLLKLLQIKIPDYVTHFRQSAQQAAYINGCSDFIQIVKHIQSAAKKRFLAQKEEQERKLEEERNLEQWRKLKQEHKLEQERKLEQEHKLAQDQRNKTWVNFKDWLTDILRDNRAPLFETGWEKLFRYIKKLTIFTIKILGSLALIFLLIIVYFMITGDK